MCVWSKYSGMYVYMCIYVCKKIWAHIPLSLRCGFILGTASMYVRKCAFKVELLYCCKHAALPLVYVWQYNILLNINIFLILFTDCFFVLFCYIGLCIVVLKFALVLCNLIYTYLEIVEFLYLHKSGMFFSQKCWWVIFFSGCLSNAQSSWLHTFLILEVMSE